MEKLFQGEECGLLDWRDGIPMPEQCQRSDILSSHVWQHEWQRALLAGWWVCNFYGRIAACPECVGGEYHHEAISGVRPVRCIDHRPGAITGRAEWFLHYEPPRPVPNWAVEAFDLEQLHREVCLLHSVTVGLSHAIC